MYIITLIDFMEITVVHISYACTGDENQVSLLIASAKQRFSLCESADRCADNHLYLTHSWRDLPRLQEGRYYEHSVCSLDNRIYVLGGGGGGAKFPQRYFKSFLIYIK